MNRQTLRGIACGAGAGALWGLVFLAPELVRSFSPLEITVGRYLCYGLIAAALIWPRWAVLSARIGRRDWRNLFLLALSGNTLYFVLVAAAVHASGVAVTSLVIGFLPVAVTIIGSRERDAVPLAQLLPSLLLCAAGALCIGWQALAAPRAASPAQSVVGLLCAAGGLVSWTAYAVGNARCLAELKQVSAHDWSLLTGLATGAQNLLLLPFALLFGTEHGSTEWLHFGAVCAGVAVLASIGGNALWNRVSQLLPLTLVGQMILFETLFALVYAFIWETRWPTALETTAFVLVVLSVLSCLSAHRTHAANLLADAAAH